VSRVTPDVMDDINEAAGRRWDWGAHDELDARGISVTLLHYAQLNPLSGPFWSRMGYRPLWTGFQSRPADALR
jgi:hypothetical protein